MHLPYAWLGHLCWSLRKSWIYYSLYRYCCRLNRKCREIWSGPSMIGTNTTEQPDESISCVDETWQQLKVHEPATIAPTQNARTDWSYKKQNFVAKLNIINTAPSTTSYMHRLLRESWRVPSFVIPWNDSPHRPAYRSKQGQNLWAGDDGKCVRVCSCDYVLKEC